MNRAIWIARFIAVLILLMAALLLMNLHSKLTRMQNEAPAATAT